MNQFGCVILFEKKTFHVPNQGYYRLFSIHFFDLLMVFRFFMTFILFQFFHGYENETEWRKRLLFLFGFFVSFSQAIFYSSWQNSFIFHSWTWTKRFSSFSVVLDTKLIFRLFMHTIFFAHTQNTVILYAFFGSIQKRIFYSNFNHFQPWFYLIDCIKTPPIRHMHFSKLCLKY